MTLQAFDTEHEYARMLVTVSDNLSLQHQLVFSQSFKSNPDWLGAALSAGYIETPSCDYAVVDSAEALGLLNDWYVSVCNFFAFIKGSKGVDGAYQLSFDSETALCHETLVEQLVADVVTVHRSLALAGYGQEFLTTMGCTLASFAAVFNRPDLIVRLHYLGIDALGKHCAFDLIGGQYQTFMRPPKEMLTPLMFAQVFASASCIDLIERLQPTAPVTATA